MKYIRISIVLLLSSVSICANCQEIENQIHKQIKKLLRYEINIDEKETPGFLVAIIEPDTTFVVAYGKKVHSQSKPDSSDYFEMGGLSKILTSIVANQLHNSGVINLHEQISATLPQLNSPELQELTGMQLLQHRSGIKRTLKGISDNLSRKKRGLSLHSPKGFQHVDQELSEEELWIALNKTPLEKNGAFIYSHYNYAILDLWIEKKTSKSVYEHAKEINIGQKTLNELFLPSAEKKADGLSKFGRLSDDISYGVLENSLGLETKMSSLVHIVKSFYLQENHEVAASVLLDPIETGIGKNIYFTKGLYKIKQTEDYTIYSHGGHSPKHSASIHFVPETKTGLVILANSEIGTKDLYLSLIRMINNNWQRKPYGKEK